MSKKQSHDQVTRRSMHNFSDIKRTMNEAIPRDDLDHSFAGKENKGPRGKQKTSFTRDTHVGDRKLNTRAFRTNEK